MLNNTCLGNRTNESLKSHIDVVDAVLNLEKCSDKWASYHQNRNKEVDEEDRRVDTRR